MPGSQGKNNRTLALRVSVGCSRVSISGPNSLPEGTSTGAGTACTPNLPLSVYSSQTVPNLALICQIDENKGRTGRFALTEAKSRFIVKVETFVCVTYLLVRAWATLVKTCAWSGFPAALRWNKSRRSP